MINLLIDDKNYENQLLNDINDIKKINCLLNYLDKILFLMKNSSIR